MKRLISLPGSHQLFSFPHVAGTQEKLQVRRLLQKISNIKCQKRQRGYFVSSLKALHKAQNSLTFTFALICSIVLFPQSRAFLMTDVRFRP
jgi:hypothetical protein